MLITKMDNMKRKGMFLNTKCHLSIVILNWSEYINQKYINILECLKNFFNADIIKSSNMYLSKLKSRRVRCEIFK